MHWFSSIYIFNIYSTMADEMGGSHLRFKLTKRKEYHKSLDIKLIGVHQCTDLIFTKRKSPHKYIYIIYAIISLFSFFSRPLGLFQLIGSVLRCVVSCFQYTNLFTYVAFLHCKLQNYCAFIKHVGPLSEQKRFSNIVKLRSIFGIWSSVRIST